MLKTERGFSLLELMIVVAVIGILSSIAYPAYVDNVRRSRIADATSELATRRVQMEQFLQDNRTYVGAPACAAPAAIKSAADTFDFSCSVLTAATYTLEANGKAAMDGFDFAIDQNNVRSTQIAGVGGGWDAVSATCWIRGKGGAC